jgi:hypothetical protein
MEAGLPAPLPFFKELQKWT